MSQMDLKTVDLNLDLQGQIGLKTFEPWEFYLQT